MDINDLRGISTVSLFVLFLALWVWAWSKRRKAPFDEAANQLFDKEEERMHQRSLEEINK